jgi:CheY-like chemotaxis protein
MKPHILLVDDHLMARLALRLFLEREGYDCDEADNGRAALDKLEAGQTVNLIISDNQMPEMTGMEFLREVKNSHLFSIPIILYSGNVTEELRQQAQQVGAHTVLAKPYSFLELLAMVRNIVPIE